jgi:hypothetical protein
MDMKKSRGSILHLWAWVGVIIMGGLLGCVSASPTALDLNDAPQTPFAKTNVATVLIFISDDCPISNRYAPELERLNAEYGKRGVKFWLVHSDKSETPPAIREHAREYSLTIEELRDTGLRLAKLSHAQATPTAAVFTRDGQLVYHGRIDDRAVDLGQEKVHATQRDLVNAMDEVLAGRAVAVPVTPVVGCAIPGL